MAGKVLDMLQTNKKKRIYKNEMIKKDIKNRAVSMTWLVWMKRRGEKGGGGGKGLPAFKATSCGRPLSHTKQSIP